MGPRLKKRSGCYGSLSLLLQVLILSCYVTTGYAHAEYRALIPNGLSVQVRGLAWMGVGHTNAMGGGNLNSFGKDFAAAGHQWTPELCAKDSDGDGWTNGQELGDPLCVRQPGGPAPSRTTCITHPGMPEEDLIPECLAQLGERSSNTDSASPEPTTPDLAPSIPIDVGGNRPETWCEDRHRAGQGATEWVTLPLPDLLVIAKPDIYTCSRFQLPSVSSMSEDEADLVEMKINHDNGLFMHHSFVMSCDSSLRWVADAIDDPNMCMRHSSSLLTTCNTLWNARIGGDTFCSPPGLIVANLGELRRRGKELVSQIHWSFSEASIGKLMTVSNASVMFGFRRRNTKAPALPEMGGWHGSPIIANNSLTHQYGPLIIPPQQTQFNISHASGRRCTLVPLKNSPDGPHKYVNIIGYRFHMHHHGTTMHIRIKRCRNNWNGEKDIDWKIDGWDVGYQPMYQVPNGGVKLYAGDTVEWTCTYNTMNVNHTVVGGYRSHVNEMCNMMLAYWPNIEAFNGCAADQYNNNLCFHEAKALIQKVDSFSDEFPIQPILDPFTKGTPPILLGWKATWFLVCLMGVVALLWAVHMALLGLARYSTSRSETQRCLSDAFSSSDHEYGGYTSPRKATDLLASGIRSLRARSRPLIGGIGRRYAVLNHGQQRNVSSYIVHLLLDTAGFIWLLSLLSDVWCMCGELAMHLQSLQINLILLISFYIVEMVWKPGMDPLLLSHHLATIAIIVLFGMELLYISVQSTDVLLVLGLFAWLEHPTFLALLMYRMAPRWKGLVHMWTFACWFWVVSKSASVVLASWLLYVRWPMMVTWLKVTYIALWAFMFSLEMFSARLQFQIRDKIRRQLQTYILAAQAPSVYDFHTLRSSDSGYGDRGGISMMDSPMKILP